MTQGSAPIRILTVADEVMVRAGLQTMLRGHPDIEVVGEARTIADAVALAYDLHADVAVIGLHDPLHVDLSNLWNSHCAGSHCKAILITPRTDMETVLDLVMDGVAGYLCEDVDPEELANAIRTVHAGGTQLDPQVASVVVGHLRDRLLGGEVPWPLLTYEEIEILQRVVYGETNRQIGSALHLQDKTVKELVSRILKKIGVKNRVAAAAWWARHSLSINT